MVVRVAGHHCDDFAHFGLRQGVGVTCGVGNVCAICLPLVRHTRHAAVCVGDRTCCEHLALGGCAADRCNNACVLDICDRISCSRGDGFAACTKVVFVSCNHRDVLAHFGLGQGVGVTCGVGNVCAICLPLVRHTRHAAVCVGDRTCCEQLALGGCAADRYNGAGLIRQTQQLQLSCRHAAQITSFQEC